MGHVATALSRSSAHGDRADAVYSCVLLLDWSCQVPSFCLTCSVHLGSYTRVAPTGGHNYCKYCSNPAQYPVRPRGLRYAPGCSSPALQAPLPDGDDAEMLDLDADAAPAAAAPALPAAAPSAPASPLALPLPAAAAAPPSPLLQPSPASAASASAPAVAQRRASRRLLNMRPTK